MILFRLMLKGEEKGRELHENGQILHKPINKNGSYCELGWRDILLTARRDIGGYIYHPHFIDHDRKDRYTGVKVEEQMLFDRDRIKVWFDGYEEEATEHVVKYQADNDYPAFDLEPHIDVESNGISHFLCAVDANIKIIGIQGVDDE